MSCSIRSRSGDVLGSAIIARDITPEKLTQGMFRLAVESCPSGMVMFDRTNCIVLVNTEVERLFGYCRDELIGQPVRMLVPDGFAIEEPRGDDSTNSDAAPAPERNGHEHDRTGLRRDGSKFPVEVHSNQIRIRDGLLVLGVITDISERRRNERLKDDFVSTVSHELRTPLTSIAGSLGLLVGGAAGQMPAPMLRLLRIAHNNSERLVRLINDILDIDKMESGTIVFDLERVELRGLVEQSIEANRGFSENYGVRLSLDPASPVAFVRADSDRLVQVVTNLLSNAIKFSPRDGEVQVAIAPRDEAFRITVRDRGAGIPLEFRPHIFEKFAQADASDVRQKGGTGLGLSIVKQIVMLLGGAVSFECPADGGTSFHVDLPRWEGLEEPEAAPSAQSSSHLALIPAPDSRSIA
jgi:PAS domain S-box-containing protein